MLEFIDLDDGILASQLEPTQKVCRPLLGFKNNPGKLRWQQKILPFRILEMSPGTPQQWDPLPRSFPYPYNSHRLMGVVWE